MSPTRVRLALGQIRVVPGEAAANLAAAESAIADAAARHADVVLLPETLDAGWTHPSAGRHAQPVPGGETCTRFKDAARRHGLHICAGITERCGERIFNAAVLIDPGGHVLLHHRKIHELSMGHDLYTRGTQLRVAETRLGTIGLMICADAFVEGHFISRTLGLMGAQLILSPCAWAVPPDHDNSRTPYGGLWTGCYAPVAREFGLGIAGCSSVGSITSA